MPSKKADPETAERLERALRKALNTPPEQPRKKAKARRKSKKKAGG